MNNRFAVSAMISAAVILCAGRPALAQFGRGGAEWVTAGSDAQRSFSIPTDTKISVDALQKSGFQFLWKTKLNNEGVQLNSLTTVSLIDRYIGYRGFRSLAFVGGSWNSIAAVDTDLSRIEWQTHLQGAGSPSVGSVACPGGLTAAIARATTAAYPMLAAGGGGQGGRGGPAKSGVGEPGEGAVTIAPLLAAAAAAAAGPGRGPQLRLPSFIYVLGGDGALHTVYMSNGEEPAPPVKFIPADANAQGLTLIDNIAYTSAPGCNGSGSGVWALDTTSKQVSEWHPTTGSVVGSVGPAFGPDGTLYVSTTGGQLIALEPKTLAVKAMFSANGQEFTSSPVVFAYKGKDLVAVGSKDGRVNLIDTAAPQSALTTTPAYSANFAPSAIASFQSPDGAHYLLAAGAGVPPADSGFPSTNGTVTNGAVAAWKVVERNGSFSLEPAWVSRDMISPLTPIVINGVVFAVSSGEYRSADPKMTAAERAKKSSPAVVYALDLKSGKSLWDSGKMITSFVHSGGLSGGASQIYLETYDQNLYAFGYYMEH